MRLTHQRWAIEQQYQELKDELGLDHFEGRTLPGWQRHVVLTALAYSWLQRERHRRGTHLPTLPLVRAVITEILTAHFFVTRPHYLDAPCRNWPKLTCGSNKVGTSGVETERRDRISSSVILQCEATSSMVVAMRQRLLLLLLLPLCVALGAAQSAQGTAPFNDSIRVADLKADLFFLAGDGFKGRLVGTPENALAAEFVRSRFERAGLKPGAPNGSFIQATNLMIATLGSKNLLELASADGTRLELKPEQDFYPQRFSASGSVRAPLVYAGFGIHAPRLGYDDYGDRAKGRIALILEHEPGERDPNSPFDGVVTAEAAVPIKKVLAAQEKGVIGVLFVTDVHNHPDPVNFEAAARAFWPAQPPRIDRFTLASWADRVRIPVGQVSPAIAEILVRGTGRRLADLSKAAETARGFQSIPLDGVEVTLSTDVDSSHRGRPQRTRVHRRSRSETER